MSGQGLVPRASPPSDDTQSGQAEARPRRRWRFAYFAGVDLDILNMVKREWTFYDSLGVAVVGLCSFSGLSAALALGYALQVPALHLWWFGVLWAAGLIFCVERLILQVPTTRKRSTFFTSLLYRGALSVLIALLLSEPTLMRLNQPEINAQLHTENRQAQERASEEIAATYEPRVTAARKELHETRTRKIGLQEQVKDYRRRRGEAAESGCGANCSFFAQKVGEKESRLRWVEKRNAHRQPELHETIDELTHRQRRAENGEAAAVDQGNGFWARVGALSAVMDRHAMMNAELWGLRALFLMLDLAPLLSLIYYLKRSGPKPYEELRVALWKQDAVLATQIEEAAGVETHRIKEQARADKEVAQAEIMLDADRRITEAGLDGAADPVDAADPRTAAPVPAPSLSSFADETRPHESEPVAVSLELRRGGIIGSLAIAVVAILATLWSALTHHAVEGMWLIVPALCGAGALAAYTRGFRRAPAWALWAIFATLVLGLVMPLLILALNV